MEMQKKEQFSDGVGYSWIDTLKEVVEDMISDQEMKDAKIKFPIKTPTTKEEYYYRSLFSNHFQYFHVISFQLDVV